MKKMEVLWVKMEVLGEGEVDKTMRVHMMRGKTKKFLKIVLDLILVVQNPQFSRLDWLASKLRRESWILLYELVTRASTREQVTKLSHENAKNPKNLKFF